MVNITSILVASPGTGGGVGRGIVGRGIEVSPLIAQIQSSLDDVNTVRANLGAVQNRIDYTMRSLDISSENLLGFLTKLSKKYAPGQFFLHLFLLTYEFDNFIIGTQ